MVSCSHHHEDKKHHHHDDKASFPASDHGDGKFIIRHSDVIYYFNTEEEQLAFQKSLNKSGKRPQCVKKAKSLSCRDLD